MLCLAASIEALVTAGSSAVMAVSARARGRRTGPEAAGGLRRANARGVHRGLVGAVVHSSVSLCFGALQDRFSVRAL